MNSENLMLVHMLGIEICDLAHSQLLVLPTRFEYAFMA